MKRKTLIAACAVAMLVIALVGCSPSTSGDGDDGSSTASEPAPASMLAVHTAGQLDGVAPEEMDTKFCISCHPRDVINAANEDYGGTPGFNPHKSHYDAGTCLNCHSVDGQSVLVCDECHTEDCPEGWIPAPRGENPVWDLKKSFKE